MYNIKKLIYAILIIFTLSSCSALDLLSSVGGGSNSNDGTKVSTNANVNAGGEQNGIKSTKKTDNRFNSARDVEIKTGISESWFFVTIIIFIGALLFLIGLLIERPSRRKKHELQEDDQ